MDGLREYAISVVAAAMLCGVLIRLTQNSGNKEIIRIMCGVFMMIILIQPAVSKKDTLWESILPEIDQQAEDISAEGTAMADNIRKEFIKQRVESYILCRAEAMEAEIQAEVILGEDCVPVSVIVTGSISPLNRSKLTQVISSELGIPKERQKWIG